MDSSVIDHQQAVDNMMAERYLLGELAPEERDAFEGHLFDCSACFEQVRAGTEFVHYVKRIGAEEPTLAGHSGKFWPSLAAGFRQPVAAFALLLFFFAGGINLYQYHLLSLQKGPALERSYMLTGIAHGGESTKLIQEPPGSMLNVNLEYTQRGEFTAYRVRLLSGSNIIKSFLIPRDQADGTARIVVSTDALKPGRYSVIVWGRNNDGNESEVGRGAFDFQFTP
jgi:hypothetical protein